jgi:hypothetical protein
MSVDSNKDKSARKEYVIKLAMILYNDIFACNFMILYYVFEGKGAVVDAISS